MTVGFISASMSTYSSYLLAFSSILLQDVVGPRLNDTEREQRVWAIQAA